VYLLIHFWERGNNMTTSLRSRTRGFVQRGLAVSVAATALFAVGGVVASPAQAAIIAGRCEYTGSQPELSRGDSGTAVRQLQCELNWAMTGANLDIDGDFGTLTYNAVRRFQGCASISVDGIAGPNTWSRANTWAASSSYVC
jgi:zinc D-Ala-D-Ala carboxypeptidase